MSLQQPAPRVLHVVETLPGGPAAYLNEILPWQIRRCGRGQVALLAPQGQYDSLSTAARDGLVEMPYPRSGRNPAALLSLFRAFRRNLASWPPDLVHAHCSFAGAICRLQRVPVPLIYCAHGWAFSREAPAPLRWVYSQIERRLQTRADAIIAISEHERACAIDAGLDGDRIVTIRHGLQPLASPSTRPPSRSDAPLKLLFIGRFDNQKGLDWLLAALAEVPEDRVHLTVVGAPVVDAPRSLAPRSNVRYLGWLQSEQINEQLDQADALIVPSRWEGFGLVVIEAMRRGVAVLVSNRGALPEVVGDDGAGIVFDLDRPQALVELLGQLTPDRLYEIGRAGRARFDQEFCAERMNAQTWSLYESAASRHAGLHRDHAQGQPL